MNELSNQQKSQFMSGPRFLPLSPYAALAGAAREPAAMTPARSVSAKRRGRAAGEEEAPTEELASWSTPILARQHKLLTEDLPLKKTATDLADGAATEAPFSTPLLDDARAVTLDETPVILVQEDAAAMAPPKNEKRNKKTENRLGFLAIAHVQSAMQPGNKRNSPLQSPVVKNLLCAATVAAATRAKRATRRERKNQRPGLACLSRESTNQSSSQIRNELRPLDAHIRSECIIGQPKIQLHPLDRDDDARTTYDRPLPAPQPSSTSV